ncbi:hypothetical protein XELAEV_18003947mg [Xenopus laevis]|uniref:Uncharacterized protein n=1 Tax=Xenopus laevis TaxID=8355 RepID=A0A974GYF3_XENLA|nr:hypothetical protein XELAEV_18003947mg [Xenopus laevis]
MECLFLTRPRLSTTLEIRYLSKKRVSAWELVEREAAEKIENQAALQTRSNMRVISSDLVSNNQAGD